MTAGSSNTAGGTGARSRALTLVEVIVVVLILLALMSLIPLVNAFAQPRTTSMCCYCGTNLKGIGASMKIYANDNNGAWPVPAFDESADGGVDYTVATGGGAGTGVSPDRSMSSVSGPGGATELAVTRAMSIG